MIIILHTHIFDGMPFGAMPFDAMPFVFVRALRNRNGWIEALEKQKMVGLCVVVLYCSPREIS